MITGQRMRAREEAARRDGAPQPAPLDATPYAERVAVQEAQNRLSRSGGDPQARIAELEAALEEARATSTLTLRAEGLPEVELTLTEAKEALESAAGEIRRRDAELEKRSERILELEGAFEQVWNRTAELEQQLEAAASAAPDETGGESSSDDATSSKSPKSKKR